MNNFQPPGEYKISSQLFNDIKQITDELVTRNRDGKIVSLKKKFAFVEDGGVSTIMLNVNSNLCFSYTDKKYTIYQTQQFLDDNPNIFEIVGELPDRVNRDSWRLISVGNQQCIIVENELIQNQMLNMCKLENHI